VTGACPLCSAEGRLEGHHPTGRIRGKPIHPGLVYRICGGCNRAQNLLWQQAGIADEIPSPEVLLRRLTLWLEFWSDRPRTSVQDRAVIEALADLADRMAMVSR